MTKEYQPIYDLDASRRQLSRQARNIWVQPQVLYESIINVLASRAGQDWQNTTIPLLTSPRYGAIVTVSYAESLGRPFNGSAAFIEIRQGPITRVYTVRGSEQPNNRTTYSLTEQESRKDHHTLSSARLLEILSDAHNSTPLMDLLQ